VGFRMDVENIVLPSGRWTIQIHDVLRMVVCGVQVPYVIDPNDRTIAWPQTATSEERFEALAIAGDYGVAVGS
jgi:hypothetical protein